MLSNKRKTIFISILIGLVLDILPLPGITVWFRPHWTLLILIYWAIDSPFSIGFFSVFCIGIILDILNGTLLGMHALGFLVVTYFFTKTYQQVRTYPFIQHIGIVFLLVVLYQFITLVILMLTKQPPHQFLYWLSALTSAIIWPWLFRWLAESW